jgi:hypothetical protein
MRDLQGSPADLPEDASHAGVGRRAFLGAVGAVGIAAATARLLPVKASTAPASVNTHCFFGSSAGVFVDIKRGQVIPGTNPPVRSRPVPGLRGVHIYGIKPDKRGYHLASRWPAGPLPGGQGPILYTIYPNMEAVISSDQQTIRAIQRIIDTAPAHSYLSAWQEAISLRSSTPKGATLAKLKLMHIRLNKMCRQSANVTYGSIFGDSGINFNDGAPPMAMCPPSSTALHVWDSVPDDLGFYAMDPYGGDDIELNMCRLETFIQNAKKKAATGYPRIILAETNNKSTSAKRVEWFERVATRMHTYGSHAVGILTFWGGAHAPLSGAWNPADKTVIDGMNHIINHILV